MAGNTVGNLNIKVGFDGSAATKGLADLTNNLSKFGSDTEKYFEKFNQLGQLIGALGSGGGFSIAAITGITAAIGKTVVDAGRLAVEFEKAGHNADTLKKHMDDLAAKNREWQGMGVVGKATSIGGEAYGGLTGSLGQAIKGLGEFIDQLTGVGSALDGLRGRFQEMAAGQAGPISGVLDAIPGLKQLNDWSDKLVGAKTLDEQRAARANQADVLAREKAKGADRQKYETGLEELRKSLTTSTQTDEEKFRSSIEELDKVIKDVFSRREGAQFLDVAALAQKRKNQLIADQQEKAAEAARKLAAEQEKLAEDQRRAAEAAAKAAEQMAKELENLASSVRTPSEQFTASMAEFTNLMHESMAAGDQVRTEVYRRKIGKLGASLMANVPEFRQVDPFAGVSLAGSQEAYRDTIRSMFPPEQLSIQERMAEGIEEMNRKSDEELAIQEEVLRVMQGQAGPRLAHLVN